MGFFPRKETVEFYTYNRIENAIGRLVEQFRLNGGDGSFSGGLCWPVDERRFATEKHHYLGGRVFRDRRSFNLFEAGREGVAFQKEEMVEFLEA